MAAYTTAMTGTNEIPPAVLIALRQSFGLPLLNTFVDQISVKQVSSIANNSTQFTFGRVLDLPSNSPTALNEYEDPVSLALSGESTTLQAVEHGQVVTRTSLADTIAGGALSIQAANVVGRAALRWKNQYATSVLVAGTNQMFAGAGTSAGLTGTDVMTPQLMNKAYATLVKAGASKDADGYFTAIMHPDTVLDLKNAVGAGSWTDVWKYSNPTTVMQGEIGRAFGFKVIETPFMATLGNQTSGTVDVYPSVFMGADALGQGVAVAPEIRITSSDKLNRFFNYGWYSNSVFGLISQFQVLVVNTASASGNNAA